jgi:hypothetical protein
MIQFRWDSRMQDKRFACNARPGRVKYRGIVWRRPEGVQRMRCTGVQDVRTGLERSMYSGAQWSPRACAKPFPDGSKIAKIEWKPKKTAESPFAVSVPDTLQDIFLIERQQTVPGHEGMGLCGV